MKYASFFSGIGGFELALDAAGHKRVFSCEIDPFCNKVVKERYGREHTEKDITKVTAERIPKADLWVGGFPCQDLSVAGKRGGITEERSGLVWRLLELAEVCGPRYLFLENVPGLLNSKRGGDLALLVRKLAHLGYVGCYRVLDAQYCGVPQRRRRVFIVGYLGAECPLEVLFEPKGGDRHPEKGREEREDPAFSLRANPSHSGDKGDGGINTTLVTGDCKGSTPKKAHVSRSDTGTGRIYVASSVQASQGHHGHSSQRGDGSDNLVVSSDKAHAVAKSSGGSIGGRDGQDDYVIGPLCAHDKRHGHAMTTQQAAESGQILAVPNSDSKSSGCLTPWDAETKRIHDPSKVAPTVAGSDGGGGQRTAYIAAPISAGSSKKSNQAGRRREDDVNIIAIQDCRGKRDNAQNGIGLQKNAPMYTVDATSRHGVASPITPSNLRQPDSTDSNRGPVNVVTSISLGSDPISKEGVSQPITRRNGDPGHVHIAPTLAAKNEPCNSAATREEWMKVCSTMDLGMGMGMNVRRLTPTECERLQGFPDGWTCLCGVRPDCPDRRIPSWVDPDSFTLAGCGHSGCGCTCPDSPRYKALGNAVAIPEVRWISDRLPK